MANLPHQHSDHLSEPPEYHAPAEAESFYRGTEPRWSGAPNQALVREFSSLEPGRVLDIGCGEGADLLWLALRGWDALGIDHAPTAVARTRALIDAASAANTGLRARVREASFPSHGESGFDLLTCSYGQLSRTTETVEALRRAVKVGGTLFLLHHDFGPGESVRPQGIILPHWLAEQLGPDFRVEKLAKSAREVSSGAGAHHRDDVVLVATRLA
ncbi:class I SAM-dependent methyltransferase [Corynebacterium sp. A21]|uniref:class I SAM-dependent methyltransferase n=1 Tax=Corynebacterium sp. A21 TaxID=3457318 RepID=UPI003FD1B412